MMFFNLQMMFFYFQLEDLVPYYAIEKVLVKVIAQIARL